MSDAETAYIVELAMKLAEATAALELIACPPRADGTYNRSREACQQLAEETLREIDA